MGVNPQQNAPTNQHPQLPFRRPQISSKREHKALNRSTLGGSRNTTMFNILERSLQLYGIYMGPEAPATSPLQELGPCGLGDADCMKLRWLLRQRDRVRIRAALG